MERGEEVWREVEVWSRVEKTYILVSPIFTLQFVFTIIHRSEAEEELLCTTVNTNWRIKMRKNAR